jgi:hypothetical protein
MKTIIKALGENPQIEIKMTGNQLADLVDACREDAEYQQYHHLINMSTESIERELDNFDQQERSPFMRHLNPEAYRCAWQQSGNTILPVKAAKLRQLLQAAWHDAAYTLTDRIYLERKDSENTEKNKPVKTTKEQLLSMLSDLPF